MCGATEPDLVIRGMCHRVMQNGSMEPHLVELSRTIDAGELGRRIRNARLAVGLTQSQLAAGDVSATLLSRIEDGQRRPSVNLLEAMAPRLGVALDELLATPLDEANLELQLAVDHAELKFLGGDAAGALIDVEAAIRKMDAQTPAVVNRAGVFLRARTLEALGDYNAAILILEDLTATPSIDPVWLKAAIGLTRCYRQSGDTAAAIRIGERAAEQAAEIGLEGATEAIQLTVTVASAYDLSGEPDHALRLCLRALETAEKYGSAPVARASAYWNASMIQTTRGDLASASDYAQKALRIFEESDDNRALAALRSAAADLMLATDPPDPAGAIEQVGLAEREMAWAANTDAEKSDLLVVKARAHLMVGDLDVARESVDRAALLVPSAATFVRADAASVAGQVAAAQGDIAQARERYREGVNLLSGMTADRRVSNLWYELAELLDEVGDQEAARDAYRAAAAASGAMSRRRATQLR